MVVDGGDNGGYVTSSHLHITLSPEHHGAVVTCEAINKIVKKRVHKDITLSVKRKLDANLILLFELNVKFNFAKQ